MKNRNIKFVQKHNLIMKENKISYIKTREGIFPPIKMVFSLILLKFDLLFCVYFYYSELILNNIFHLNYKYRIFLKKYNK